MGTPDWNVYDITAGRVMLSVTHTGFVGIKKDPPAYPLDVTGDVNITGGVYRINGVALAVGVASVFGRTGAVVAAIGDYTAAQVTNAVSTLGTYADPAWITSLAWAKITGAPAQAVSSVFGRTGAVVAGTGDYTAAQVTNAVSTISGYSDPAWITSLAWGRSLACRQGSASRRGLAQSMATGKLK